MKNFRSSLVDVNIQLVNLCLIVGLELGPLQLEGGSDQIIVGGPSLPIQQDVLCQFKALHNPK